MPTIIHKQPFRPKTKSIEFHEQSIRIKSHQIIVWVTVGEIGWKEQEPLPETATCIPVVLDTGTNHEFVIRESHLTGWCSIYKESLSQRHKTKLRGVAIPQYAAHIWLHPYRRERFDDPPAFRFRLNPGIAVIPRDKEESLGQRLPVLGLRALERAGLHVEMDCKKRALTIRTGRPFWFIG